MINILVPLTENFEEIEAIVPIDIWRRAGFEVTTAGLKVGSVRASRHTVHIPDALLADVIDYPYDLIFLPGGKGAYTLAHDERLLKRLQKQAAENKYLSAICAAPLALARAELLQGKKFTCHSSIYQELQKQNLIPQSENVVVDQKLVTGAGPGAAFDLALNVVELFSDRQKRMELEKALVYSTIGSPIVKLAGSIDDLRL